MERAIKQTAPQPKAMAELTPRTRKTRRAASQTPLAPTASATGCARSIRAASLRAPVTEIRLAGVHGCVQTHPDGVLLTPRAERRASGLHDELPRGALPRRAGRAFVRVRPLLEGPYRFPLRHELTWTRLA